jgi:hypothetical protein
MLTHRADTKQSLIAAIFLQYAECTQSACMCFRDKQPLLSSANNQLVFAMEMRCVYCEV